MVHTIFIPNTNFANLIDPGAGHRHKLPSARHSCFGDGLGQTTHFDVATRLHFRSILPIGYRLNYTPLSQRHRYVSVANIQ